MSGNSAGALEGAWAYERLHVDALFRQWPEHVLAAADVSTGERVLDVACGTGVLARQAVDLVGPTGSVTALDIDAGMLAVAESIEPRVAWTQGDATHLPFDDGEFDAVVSQFGLMFFPDRVRSIREMLRCATTDGRVAVAVWGSLDKAEVYPSSVDLFDRMIGPAAADALRAPFVLGDTTELRNLFETAGAKSVSVATHMGQARFPSVRSMVEADLRGWVHLMGVDLTEELIEQTLVEAEYALAEHVNAEGTMTFDIPAHIVTARA